MSTRIPTYLVILPALAIFLIFLFTFSHFFDYFVAISPSANAVPSLTACQVLDQDQDLFDSTACGGGDCNDGDPTVYPTSQERCDLIDNNCNRRVDEGFDRDRDGYSQCTGDCDDFQPVSYPGRLEICDGYDNNCDGAIDESCGCVKGTKRSCGTDSGNCASGTQYCLNSGNWGICQNYIGPKEEICGNGKDEDCDGLDAVCLTPLPTPDHLLPEPPSLLITNIEHDRITLTWVDNSENEAGFVIQKKIGASGTFEDYAVIAKPNARAYNDFSVGPRKIYFYRVRTYNQYGSSGFSNEVGETTPSVFPAENQFENQ